MNKTGKEVKGNLTADSMGVAKTRIKGMGIMLISIKEKKSGNSPTKAGGAAKKPGFSFGSKVSVDDLAIMTRQLATLIKAKIQIVDALAAVMDQVENDYLRLVLSEVRQKVNEGASLAKGMSDYPKIFNNVYVNMVESGEASGTLDIVLLRLADFTEARVKLTNKIRGAMIYPTIMTLFGGVMMMFIFIFVIPKITKIFVSMKKTLPLQTQICISISNFLQNYWMVVIIGGIVGFFAFQRWISTKSGESLWHRLLLKLPLVGKIIMMINVSRFSSTLATLLNSGVPILAALRIVKNLVANVHMSKAVDDAREAVSEGSSMAGPLIKSGLYPPLVTHMISLGEKSGELEPMLQIVAENYENQVDSRLNALTSTLEPIMMIVMGCAVGFIVFSVIVPMMSLNSLK